MDCFEKITLGIDLFVLPINLFVPKIAIDYFVIVKFRMDCFEKITFDIDLFVLPINLFVPKIAIDYFVIEILIAINSLVFAINIAITYFVLKTEITFAIVPFVLTLWTIGSLAIEDDEEREADQPEEGGFNAS